MALLHHGGRLQQAAREYGIAEAEWLDLSTGVSPWHYPVPDIPDSVWNRLPQDDDGLVEAADRYYGGRDALPVAGSQAVIQALPCVLAAERGMAGRALLPKVGYKEHERAWRRQGWQLDFYAAQPEPQQIQACDVLLLINPNNPSGWMTPPSELKAWLGLLPAGGYLVLDEAFMDATPEHSLMAAACDRLVILRSVGKFFGLAGIRAGFVFAPANIRAALEEQLGPWCLNGPARMICRQAFADVQWQQMQRRRIHQASDRLRALLAMLPGSITGTALFQTIYLASAPTWHESLCRQGVLTRLTDERDGLRFGLPAEEQQWLKLAQALKRVAAELNPVLDSRA